MIIRPEEHSFYDDLVTMLVSLSSYFYAMQVSIGLITLAEGKKLPPGTTVNYIEPVMSDQWPLNLAAAGNLLLVFFPPRFTKPMAKNQYPSYIEYETIIDDQKSAPEYTLTSDANKRMVSQIIGSSFVSYYSRCEKAIKAKYKGGIDKWPDTLRFAWAMRNCFAHGGSLAIDNPTSRPIVWRTFQFDASQSGQRCLFDAGKPSVGDIIILMQDMDQLL